MAIGPVIDPILDLRTDTARDPSARANDVMGFDNHGGLSSGRRDERKRTAPRPQRGPRRPQNHRFRVVYSRPRPAVAFASRRAGERHGRLVRRSRTTSDAQLRKPTTHGMSRRYTTVLARRSFSMMPLALRTAKCFETVD